jgi:HSP20 family protein
MMSDLHGQSITGSIDGPSSNETPWLASGVVSWQMSVIQHAWRPPTDLIEMDDKFVVRVEISGMRDGEFAVTVENNTLTVSGTRADTNERRAYHQMEIHFGDFSTEIELPVNVNLNQILAEYEDGFLWVQLPKAQPKHIPIVD